MVVTLFLPARLTCTAPESGVICFCFRVRSRRVIQLLWVAKTSTATKNETVLGREGLNTTLASTLRENFGGQEPVWAYSTHTY